MQQKIGQFPALLHQVDPRQAGDALGEIADAQQFAENHPGIVKTQGLIEIADQQIFFGPVF